MRITDLQDQGYSLSHASMIAACEWSLSSVRYLNGDPVCAVCGDEWAEAPFVHFPYCPIPSLGYAVLHEQDWMRRRCRGCGSVIDEDGKECDGYGD